MPGLRALAVDICCSPLPPPQHEPHWSAALFVPVRRIVLQFGLAVSTLLQLLSRHATDQPHHKHRARSITPSRPLGAGSTRGSLGAPRPAIYASILGISGVDRRNLELAI